MFSRLAIPASRLAVRAALPRASPLVAARPVAAVFASSSRSPLARFYSSGGEGAPDKALTKENVEARILDIFQGFDKVKQDKVRARPCPLLPLAPICARSRWLAARPALAAAPRPELACHLPPSTGPLTAQPLPFRASLQLSLDASFTEDLGLDSLDAVEVIMAIEEDFFIEVRPRRRHLVRASSRRPREPHPRGECTGADSSA